MSFCFCIVGSAWLPIHLFLWSASSNCLAIIICKVGSLLLWSVSGDYLLLSLYADYTLLCRQRTGCPKKVTNRSPISSLSLAILQNWVVRMWGKILDSSILFVTFIGTPSRALQLLWSVPGDCLLLSSADSWQSAFVKCCLWSSLLLWSVGGDCLLLSSFVRLTSGQVDGNGGCGGAWCMVVFQ